MDSQFPHQHTLTPENYPNTGLGDHNYCRNPDGWHTVWCYTTDPDVVWHDCDIGQPSETCDETTSAAPVIRSTQRIDEYTSSLPNIRTIKHITEPNHGSRECYRDHRGRDYRGTLHVTLHGEVCQKWTDQFPHQHTVTPENYPNTGLGDHNYCRNPDGWHTAWCYTTDPDVVWHDCDIGPPNDACVNEIGLTVYYNIGTITTTAPIVRSTVNIGEHTTAATQSIRIKSVTEHGSSECYRDHRGRDYRGTVHVTDHGEVCQKWTDQFPHQHAVTPENYPNTGLGDHNYCRNPDGWHTAWCYTTDPNVVWHDCDIGPPNANCDVTTSTVSGSGTTNYVNEASASLSYVTTQETRTVDTQERSTEPMATSEKEQTPIHSFTPSLSTINEYTTMPVPTVPHLATTNVKPISPATFTNKQESTADSMTTSEKEQTPIPTITPFLTKINEYTTMPVPTVPHSASTDMKPITPATLTNKQESTAESMTTSENEQTPIPTITPFLTKINEYTIMPATTSQHITPEENKQTNIPVTTSSANVLTTVSDTSECYTDINGRDYRGTVHVTHHGEVCQKWTSQFPHQHAVTPENYPNTGLGDHNYCRNPDGWHTAWCYTTDFDVVWHDCDIGPMKDNCDVITTTTPVVRSTIQIGDLTSTLPELTSINTTIDNQGSNDCYTQADGSDYRGNENATRHGDICQKWTDQSPHHHIRTPTNYPNAGLGDHNYCRNPDGKVKPWCYTTNHLIRWRYCDVGEPVGTCGTTSQPHYTTEEHTVTVLEATIQTEGIPATTAEPKLTTEGTTSQPHYTTEQQTLTVTEATIQTEDTTTQILPTFQQTTELQLTTIQEITERTNEMTTHYMVISEEGQSPTLTTAPFRPTTNEQTTSPGEEECYTDPNGLDYRGSENMTSTGDECEKWTSLTAAHYSITPSNYPNTGLGDHNYCRNPDGKDGPWCFTNQFTYHFHNNQYHHHHTGNYTWSYCNVGNASSNCELTTQYMMTSEEEKSPTLTTTPVIPTTNEYSILPGALYIDVNCDRYYVMSDKRKWHASKSQCELIGGVLASLHTKPIFDAVRQFIVNSGFANGIRGYWIGLNDITAEGVYQWLNGETFGWTAWASGEPNNNNRSNTNGQDCVQLWKRRNYEWDDNNCRRKRAYICQTHIIDCNISTAIPLTTQPVTTQSISTKEPTKTIDTTSIIPQTTNVLTTAQVTTPFLSTEEPTTNIVTTTSEPITTNVPTTESGSTPISTEEVRTNTVTTSPTTTTEQGSPYTDVNCDRYSVDTEKRTWHASKSQCESLGGVLASLHTQSVFQNVRTFIMNGNFDNGVRGYWIGLNDLSTEGSFEWLNGDVFGWTAWAKGEPNNKVQQSVEGQDCVQVWKRRAYKWDDNNCNAKRGYICQTPILTTQIISTEEATTTTVTASLAPPTTNILTTKQGTTQSISTEESPTTIVTSALPTTEVITTKPVSTQPISTDEPTTNIVTTTSVPPSTNVNTTKPGTTNSISTEESPTTIFTSALPTTEVITTKPGSTPISTEQVRTNIVTTGPAIISTKEPSTTIFTTTSEPLTRNVLTTEPVTTQPISTEEPTPNVVTTTLVPLTTNVHTKKPVTSQSLSTKEPTTTIDTTSPILPTTNILATVEVTTSFLSTEEPTTTIVTTTSEPLTTNLLTTKSGSTPISPEQVRTNIITANPTTISTKEPTTTIFTTTSEPQSTNVLTSEPVSTQPISTEEPTTNIVTCTSVPPTTNVNTTKPVTTQSMSTEIPTTTIDTTSPIPPTINILTTEQVTKPFLSTEEPATTIVTTTSELITTNVPTTESGTTSIPTEEVRTNTVTASPTTTTEQGITSHKTTGEPMATIISTMPPTTSEVTTQPGLPYIDVNCDRYSVGTEKRTWHASKSQCEFMGGVLASLHTQSVFQNVRTFIMNGNFDNGVRGYWIGLNDLSTEGTFEWLNGDVFGWTAWAKGEPNNKVQQSGEGQDCVQVWKKRAYKWDDNNCNAKRGYICQTPIPGCFVSTEVAPITTNSGSTESGTTNSISTEESPTTIVTSALPTTEVITTKPGSTPISTEQVRTNIVTTGPATISTKEPSTTIFTTTSEPLTRNVLTTEPVTSQSLSTKEPTTTIDTTSPILPTTNILTTVEVTPSFLSTEEPTTTIVTTTSEPLTTNLLTTKSGSTPISPEQVRTNIITANPTTISTKEPATTIFTTTSEPLSTNVLTSEPVTTQPISTEEPTTIIVTTTSVPPTTNVNTTKPVTTQSMSTKIPTTTIDTTSPIPPTINILTTKQGTTSIHTEEVRTNTVTASPRTTTEQGITSHKTTGEPMATIISTMPPTTSEVTTQPGSPYIDVNCNRYSVGTEKRTWHASKSQCEFMGGVLASLHTQSVFQNVRTFIMNGNFDNGVRGYWIGLNDLSTEGTFEWLNGDVFGWTAWAKGEPNNKVQQSGEGQDCVQVWKKRAYKWDDNNCNAKRGYICQTPIPGCFVSTEVAPITTNSGSTESGTTNSISTEESPTTIFTSALPTTEVITTKPGSTPISTEQVRTNIVTTGPATISTKEPSTTIFTTTSEPLTRNVLTTEPVTTQPISTEEPTPNVVTTTLVPLTTNVHTKKPVTSSFLSTEEPTTTIVTTTSEPLTTNLLTTKSGSTPISPEQVRTNIITANPTTISTKEPATTIFTTTSEPLSTNVITSEPVTTQPISSEEPTTIIVTTTLVPTTANVHSMKPVTTQSISTKEPRTTIDSTSRIPPTTNMLTTEQGTTQSISTEESTTNIVTPALPNTEVITMKPVTTQRISTEEPTTNSVSSTSVLPTTNVHSTKPVTTQSITTEEPTTTIDTTSPIPPTTNKLTTEQETTPHKTTGEQTATIISTNMPPTTNEVTIQPGLLYIDVNCDRYNVVTEKRTWHASKSHCESMGGVLASLHTQSVFQNVRTFIMNSNFDNDVRGYWIGLNDLSTEGSFEWLNGDVFGWTAWAKGQPNSNVQQSVQGQDCVQVWKQRAYKWDDNNCNAKRGYICQTPITGCSVSTEVAPITTSSDSTESVTTQIISTEKPTTTVTASSAPPTTNMLTTEQGTTQSISTEESPTTIVTSALPTTEVITIKPVTTQPISTEEPTTSIVTTTLVPPTTNVHTTKSVTTQSITTEEPTTTINTTSPIPPTTNILTTEQGNTPNSTEELKTNIVTSSLTTTTEQVTTTFLSTEQPTTTTVTTTSVPPTKNVLTTESGTPHIDVNCDRYNVISDKRTWHAAKDHCESIGGVLASLHTQSVFQNVRTFIMNSNFDNGVRGYWIGLNDLSTEGSFEWLNGDALGWTAWATGEPNNSILQSVDGQDCVQVWKKRTYKWDDNYCHAKRGYICQTLIPGCSVSTEVAPITLMDSSTESVTTSHISTEKPTTTIVTTSSVPPTTDEVTTEQVNTPYMSTAEPSTTIVTTTSIQSTTNTATTEQVTTAYISTEEPTTSIAATTSVPPTTNVATTEQVATSHISTDEPTTSITTTSVAPTTNVVTAGQVTTPHISTEEQKTSAQPTTNVATTEPVTTPHISTEDQKTTIVTTAPAPPTTNIATTQPEPAPTTGCTPSGPPITTGFPYIDVNCERYHIIANKHTWHASKGQCEDIGGVLASINTQPIFKAVRQFIMNGNFDNSIRGYWIGLNDITTEGSFEWLNGDTFGWTAWAAGQPNDNHQQSSSGEDCVQLWKKKSYKWDDNYCHRKLGYICQTAILTTPYISTEQPTTTIATTTSVPPTTNVITTEQVTTQAISTEEPVTTIVSTTSAPTTNVFTTASVTKQAISTEEPVTTIVSTTSAPTTNILTTESGCIRYHVVSSKKTWQQSKSECENIGGVLASLHTQAIFQAVRSFILNGNFDGKVKGYWIGLNDLNNEGSFEWLNGEPFDWTRWANKQPNDNNQGSSGGQDCVQLWKKTSYTWDDNSCHQKRGYVCQTSISTCPDEIIQG
uniref:Uncharacterized protein LOC100369221 n=1 Tax=Saccoglossus kowalevskii TaxID=10224 RepID=A0ABM0M5U8_SACKO|nr:PREDICTED: uncharacterized protein LOC100369221 [Saccoglossus kowalevskii]